MLPVKPHMQTILYKTAKDTLRGGMLLKVCLAHSKIQNFVNVGQTSRMCSVNKL